jgi:hypothetical protein
MKRSVALTLLLFIVISIQAFSQSSNANLSGTIQDSTGGVMAGVKVTATNTATGVENTAISNNSGIYTFPSLLPGEYKVGAEKTGFQVQTFKDVPLGNAAQLKLNFKLNVAGKEQTVEVSVAADRLLLESSSSAGDLLSELTVQNLPQVNSNALDLVRVIPGFIPTSGNAVFDANGTTISGVSVGKLNLQRDGIAISEVRQPAGVKSPTQINPDMVAEFRIIASPVDAEVGRGNSQIQVLTKSGTGEFHGGVVWDIQNSALDSNQWDNNRNAIVPPWRNLHQYTLSLGGPIIKKKTFFFALWNGQVARLRDSYTPLALTPCARKGIFRYFDNWNNGMYNATLAVTGTPSYASVDYWGNPVAPPALQPSMLNADGTRKSTWQPHNGILRYKSVFGIVQNENSMASDCSNAIVNTATGVTGGGWDANRKPIDTTGFKGDLSGFIDNFLSLMPNANRYDAGSVFGGGGDGLNTAGARWTRGTRGADNMYGIGEDGQRKQLNLKIDHIFNGNHKISGSWSFEKNWADNNFANWPGAYGGRVERQPQIITFNYSATISSTVLNEARFGMMRTGNNGIFPLENPETGAEAISKLPVINGFPVAISPGVGGTAFNIGGSNYIGGRGNIGLGYTNHDISPRWTFADTIAWMSGKHMFKAGAEYRLIRSKTSVFGTAYAYNSTPIVNGGDPTGTEVTGINSTNMPGLAGTTGAGNQRLMQNLLSFLAGSVGAVNQFYFINSLNKLTSWNNPLSEKEKVRDMHQRGFDFFFKDDWKIHQNLTLNLGLRYEYYGVPFINSGLTAGFKGGSGALYGISGRSWSEGFWAPGARADLTDFTFVGPNSPNPGWKVYPRDGNNFGPAVGFAWQLPWFGKGKTTIRGGYQVSYLEPNNASEIEQVIGNPPGSTSNSQYTPSSYLNLDNLKNVIPAVPTAKPMATVPLTDRNQGIYGYDPNFKTPYIQNITLSVARNIGSKFTIDARYIGTLSRKMVNDFNLNTPNFLTNGLKEAFDAARYGDDTNPTTKLLDQIFAPLRGANSGAKFMRTNAQLKTPLANGNYSGLATTINNWVQPGTSGLNTIRGYLLRTAGLPENFIVTNPQFSTVNLRTNWGKANYHSMQAQVSMRPTAGVTFQLSYTWSKNLGNLGGAYTDPRNRAADYTVLASDRPHVLTSYGSFNLPIGPNRIFFGKTSGFVARVLENWQLGWIANVASGNPINVTAQNMLYANGVPDQVGLFPFDKMGVYWETGALRGNYFANSLLMTDDPQKNTSNNPNTVFGVVTAKDSLNTNCTLLAVKDAGGNLILQNPLPGNRGTFGQNRFYGIATWNLDMSMSKSVRIGEAKSISLRVDSTNIFNHAQPSGALNAASTRIYFASAPTVNINTAGTYFGQFATKVGNRVFQARIRFTF